VSVKHAPAPKAAAEVVGVVGVAGMVEVVGVAGMVEVVEEVEGADTKIPVSYELRPRDSGDLKFQAEARALVSP
jgi:hypothetical protein